MVAEAVILSPTAHPDEAGAGHWSVHAESWVRDLLPTLPQREGPFSLPRT